MSALKRLLPVPNWGLEMVDIDAILTAMTGGAVSAGIAKMLISKAFKDLDNVSNKINEISEQLSAIKEKLAGLEKHDAMIIAHEGRIAALEATLSTMTRRKGDATL